MGKGKIWRRRLIALGLLVAALAAGYWFWLRESSLVEVREVEVKGVTVNEVEVATALEAEAVRMTTLDVDEGALASAAGRFPTVSSIRVDSSPLHKLEIEVTERLPAAVAELGGAEVPVSADGYLLRGVEPPADLPALELSEPVRDARLGEHDADQAALLGEAPEELRKTIETARFDDAEGGVSVELRNGIELRFGDASEAAAKWAAAAALLASPELGEPAYLDVSVPDRPVTGGVSG